MRLPRLLRTTSFRLTLLYAGLFCTSVLLLFGVVFWSGSNFMTTQLDQTVSNEIAEIQKNAAGKGIEGLQETVAAYVKVSPPGVYYVLEDPSGRRLAGNMPALKPTLGVLSWPSREDDSGATLGVRGVRGRGVRVADGGYLFVGVDSYQLGEMRESITQTFLWGLVVTVVLAFAGGMLMSFGLLRRVEAISQTSREIVSGDLRRRISIRGTNDEFDHLATSLNTMLDRIEGLMEGLREVSSDIAHDLRTPLTRLRQRLELARRRALSVETLHEALDNSIHDVDSILETFSALLRIAQIEAHTKAAGLAPLNLSAMLEDMIETYRSVAEEQGQSLSGHVQDGLSITGDRELLPQLFSNLIENAITHCPTGSIITLKAASVPDGIEVSVADNGPGVPAEMCDKVLQRFYRLERSRTSPGTGLGLSLASAIANLHQARIELLDNQPGLLVRLRFPAPSKTV